MQVTISFSTDNAAFQIYAPAEVERVLLDASNEIACHYGTGLEAFQSSLYDHNGNTIGTVSVTADEN